MRENALTSHLNTAAPVDPTEALPDQDLLPLYSRDEGVSRSCAALGGRLSHAAEFALLFHGLAFRWVFFLFVPLCPPFCDDSYWVVNRLPFMVLFPFGLRRLRGSTMSLST